MARNRQWYEDVMDVALRATLKEFGFKRKSRTNYICEYSPERVWVFEIEPWRQRQPFRDWSGIFVPEIEDIVTRVAPEIGTHETFLRNPSQFRTSVADLVNISRGWDERTWEKNPKSRHWLWGFRNPPRIEKVISLWDGNWWDPDHVKAVLARNRTAEEFFMRSPANDWVEKLKRDRKETAEAVGRELDILWREHAHDWLRKCDDLYYLAQWFDKHVYSQKHVRGRDTCAVTAATAWHLVGNDSRAVEILNGVAAKNEAIAEDRTKVTEEYSDSYRNIAKAARRLAKCFGQKM